MIQCCNIKCDAQWFHKECVEFAADRLCDDWWCSAACRTSGHYIYCVCHKSTNENDDMVQCELGQDCTKDEWYHPTCLCVDIEHLPGTLAFLANMTMTLTGGSVRKFICITCNTNFQMSGTAQKTAKEKQSPPRSLTEFWNIQSIFMAWPQPFGKT